MAEQTAAAQPAAAEPGTNATPVAAPGADATPVAKPGVKPKRGEARHAEIRAKLNATSPKAAETPPAGADKTAATAASTEAKPAETEKPKPAVGAVMRLTAENTRLKGQLDELQGKLTAASKGETVESLREKVRKDPAVLFDVFGADLDADENNRLAKLNDAVLGRSDPEHAKQREVLSEVEKLKKQLADKDAEVATTASRERDTRARAHTAQLLTEGHKSDDGKVVIDPAKFPYVNHLTKVGIVDAHAGVMQAARDLVADFRKTKDREPTDGEIAGMIGIAATEAEKHFSAQAQKWQLPTSAAAAPAEDEQPAARRTPTTIGSQLGNRQPTHIDRARLTKAERHEEIRARLRRGNQPSVN